MATNFPTSLDALTNPTSSDSLSSPSHSAQHANVNDAVEALQAKVGVDGSAVTSSLDYQLANIGTWTSFTPTWNWEGSGSITTSFNYGRYSVLNDIVFIQAGMSIASYSGSGKLRLVVPAGASISADRDFVRWGTGDFSDQSGPVSYSLQPYVISGDFEFLVSGGWILTDTSMAAADEVYVTIVGRKA